MEERIIEQWESNEYVMFNSNVRSIHDKILRFDKSG